MYITWSSQKDFASKMPQIEKSIASYGNIYGGHIPIIGRSPQTIGNTTIRSTFNKSDYNYYRPGESRPQCVQDSIAVCDKAYTNVPIVRSVIDMMADFTVQGIRIEHRDAKIQSFINEWMKFINFDNLSERIANTLYRIANVPVQITYGKVPLTQERKWQKASADLVITPEKQQYKNIPLKYNILHPLVLEVIGGDVLPFIDKPLYGFKVSTNIDSDIKRWQSIKSELVNNGIQITSQNLIAKPITVAGKQLIPIDQKNLEVLFYKKDDWMLWSWPMVHAILDALFMLEKMHLADKKALDGAISQIRLWTIGNYEYKAYPTAAIINKLRDVLSNVSSGDVMDIVWGPDLKFQESDPKGYNFLKSEKYQQVMTEIYAGLGVPPSLTGVSNGNQGFGNNSISMKAMVERLEYGRKILRNFWEKQLKILKEAFGWKYDAHITFDYQVMTDETLEKKILLDLWDRNIISTKKIRELCGQDPILEELRIKKEHSKINSGTLPPKASPYHSPETPNELKKIIMQGGGVAPSELGVNLQPKKEGEKSLEEIKTANQSKIAKLKPNPTGGLPIKSKPKGKPGQGRPLGKKDSSKRIRKERPRKSRANISSTFEDNCPECPYCESENTNHARTDGSGNAVCNDCGEFFTDANYGMSQANFITLFSWANDIQDNINDFMTDFCLHQTGKKNLRSLTKAEVHDFEMLKLSILCNMKPFESLDNSNILEKLDGALDNDIIYTISVLNEKFQELNGRDPTLKEIRQIQSSAYALKYENNSI